MYIEVHNPIGSKTHLSPGEAERLVYYGHASYMLMDDGTRKLHYLKDYEVMRLRADLNQQYDVIAEDRTMRIGRGGTTSGEWYPRRSGSGHMAGAPQERAQQYEMTLDWIADSNRGIDTEEAA